MSNYFKLGSLENDIARTLVKFIGRESNSNVKNETNSNIIGFSGTWGTGKTYFFEKFQEHFYDICKENTVDIKESNCTLKYLSIWEMDWHDNAFDPIVYFILENILESIENCIDREKIALELNKKEFFAYLFNQLFEDKIKIMVESLGKIPKIGQVIKSSKEISQLYKDYKEKFFDEVKFTTDEQKLIDSIDKNCKINDRYNQFLSRDMLLKNTIELIKLFIKIENKKFVIIIDDIDRCKPSFAIDVLEVIKHYFDIENFYFIISYDKKELNSIIKKFYGYDYDTDRFLLKIMHKNIEFEMYDNSRLIHSIVGLDNLNSVQEYINNTILELSSIFNLTRREIIIIFSNNKELFDVDINSISSNGKSMHLYKLLIATRLFLTIFKTRDNEKFNNFLESRIISLNKDVINYSVSGLKHSFTFRSHHNECTNYIYLSIYIIINFKDIKFDGLKSYLNKLANVNNNQFRKVKTESKFIDLQKTHIQKRVTGEKNSDFINLLTEYSLFLNEIKSQYLLKQVDYVKTLYKYISTNDLLGIEAFGIIN